MATVDNYIESQYRLLGDRINIEYLDLYESFHNRKIQEIFSTILKGCYNDPALITEGFKNYTILHETYALTRLVAFILTGKATADRITDAKLKAFVEKGLSSDKEKRFKSVAEMETAFRTI